MADGVGLSRGLVGGAEAPASGGVRWGFPAMAGVRRIGPRGLVEAEIPSPEGA